MCPVVAVFCFTAWQPHTVALEAIADALIATDAAQTAELTREGFQERESDCIIGHHPKPASVALYFGGLTLGHVLVTNALEKVAPRWADVWQGVTIGWEAGTVTANVRLGVRF